MLRFAATAFLAANGGVHAAASSKGDALLQARVARLEALLLQQQTVIEDLRKEHRLLAEDDEPRRRLFDYSEHSGITVKRNNSAVILGELADVALARSGESELTLIADVVVDGDLRVADVDGTVAEFIADATARLEAMEAAAAVQTVHAASGWFPGVGSDFAAYTKSTPIGNNDMAVVLEIPVTATPGYGLLSGGVFTAPEDGVYFMTAEVRIDTTEAATASFEIQFTSDADELEGFEMWIPEDNDKKRRTAMSCILHFMRKGDQLWAKSDVADNQLKAQIDVIQIADSLAAVSAVTSGSSYTAKTSLMTPGTETVFFARPEAVADSYADGVFKAPRKGVYFFFVKLRTSDDADGDMEIQFKKNGQSTDNNFEMWLHSGDFSGRRAHMSAMLEDMDEDDEVMATSDLTIATTMTATFSAFELPPDTPSFKMGNNGAFTYPTKHVTFGEGSSGANTIFFENGSDGAIVDGAYTAPEDGMYYFLSKLRAGDNTASDWGLEYLLNGADAAHNMVMWSHLGDDSGRRASLSTAFIKLREGDVVTTVSNTALLATETFSRWTLSGFKVAPYV